MCFVSHFSKILFAVYREKADHRNVTFMLNAAAFHSLRYKISYGSFITLWYVYMWNLPEYIYIYDGNRPQYSHLSIHCSWSNSFCQYFHRKEHHIHDGYVARRQWSCFSIAANLRIISKWENVDLHKNTTKKNKTKQENIVTIPSCSLNSHLECPCQYINTFTITTTF